MSYGAISAPAVRALSRGAKRSGLLDGYRRGRSVALPRRGRLRHHHADRHRQVRRAGRRRRASSVERIKEIARARASAFEIKLSQGAKPGKGGVLPAAKVTEEIAAIRGIPPHRDSISPNRHRDIANADELLDRLHGSRDLTGKPVGVKTAIGGWEFVQDLCEAVQRARTGVRRRTSW